MCDCFNGKLQTLKAQITENEESQGLHVSWIDDSLSLTQNSQFGLGAKAVYTAASSDTIPRLMSENFFIPFTFCPFCGEKLSEPSSEYMTKKAEDKEAFAIFTKLEEDLEERFDNITVKNLQEAYETALSLLEEVDLEFKLIKHNEEQRMEILYKGHFKDLSIELFLEEDEDAPGIYTVSVF